MTAAGLRPIVLATGGTGGHVFPAEALAGELAARGAPFALVTDSRGRRWGGALADRPVHRIAAASPSGGAVGTLRGMAGLAVGAVQAFAALGRIAPSAVVGFGGYASVPTVLAARLRRIPTVIHEQNAVLGRANRLLAGGAARIATAFAKVRFLRSDDPRMVEVGNPVRDAVRAARAARWAPPDADGDIRLLAIGGSQGAASFGAVIPAALVALPEALRQRITIAQQCRPEDLEGARAVYAAAGLRAELAPFFADFPARLAAAHLLIARSGASTVAELAVAGRPSILVPYPHAADDHQRANAAALVEAGAAILLPHDEFSPGALGASLVGLLGDPARLAAMADAARAAGRPDAAARLAEIVIEVARGVRVPYAAAGRGAAGGAGA